MPQPIGSLFVSLTADVQPYANAMARAQSTTSQAASNIERSAGVAERSVNRFSGTLGNTSSFRPYSLIAVSRAFDNASDRAGLLRGAVLATTGIVGGFSAALGSNLVLRYADSFTKLNNLLRSVSDSTQDTAARFTQLTQVATASRSSLESTALLYARIQKAAPYESAGQVLQFVETIQKALTMGGATTEEARSAAIQLSQAIASNRLGGDELRAVLETPLGSELAKGLGMTIGQFREAGQAGEITALQIFDSLKKIKESVDVTFGRATLTVDQALTQVDNRLTEYFGKVNLSYGATKLLSGAISGFGNNLETIMPVLGAVSGFMIAAFAGRGISGAGGGLINSIKTQSKEAKERVIELRSQLNSLQESLVNAEMKRSTLARAAGGDSSAYASPAASKGLERAEMALGRSRDKVLDAVQARRKAEADLQNITAVSSPRAVKLSDDLAAAEQRVNEAIARQQTLRQALVSARSRETAALGIQTTTSSRLQATRDAARDRATVEKAIAQTDSSILKDRETIANRQVQIAQLSAQADQKAAQQRVEAIRRVAAAAKQVSDARTSFGVAGLDLSEAQRAVAITGDQNARRGLAEQTATVRQLQNAIAPVASDLVGASKAATGFGLAGNFLKAQALSLINLFGGPWGVAITGAITVLGILGLRAREEAEKIAEAKKIIDERLERAGQGGTSNSAEARQSNQSILAQKIQDDLRKVEDEFDRIAGKSHTSINLLQGMFSGTSGSVPPEIEKGADQIDAIVQKFKAGDLNAAQFKDELQRIGQTAPVLKSIVTELSAQADALNRARLAAQGLKQDLSDVGNAKPVFFRGAEIKSLQDLQDATTKGTAKAIIGINQQIEVEKLKARGQDAAADALQKYFELISQDKPEIANRKELESQYTVLEGWKKKTKEFVKAKTELENFQDQLKRMKEEAAGAFLGDVDRQVLQLARAKKATPDSIAEYVKASKSGDFSKVTPDLLNLRQIELTKKAGQEYRQVIDQYGTWQQIAPLAAEKQQILNIAVERGYITAGQAKVAYADFLAGFHEYKWINDTTDAIGTFAETAIMDFNNVGNAALNLAKALEKVALEAVVIDPLKNAFKAALPDISSSFTSFFSFGTSATRAPAAAGAAGGTPNPVSLFHSGGVVGSASASRFDNPTFYTSAPRFHTGLTTDEFRAILKRGEHVLTEGDASRTANVMSGLADRPGSGTNVAVYISGVPAGHTATAKKSVNGSGVRVDVSLQQMIAADIATQGPIAKAIEGQYKLNRTAGGF